MIVGRYQLSKPRLVPTLATVLLFPALISLGVWQLHRADYKYALRAQRERNAAQPPVELRPRMTDTKALLGRKVRVRGHFDLAHQLLLDNRPYRGVPGYYVYTLLRLDGTNQAVLVNRGWVAQGVSRRTPPPLPGPRQGVALVGVVDRLPNVGLRLGTPGEGYKGWPKVVQYVDRDWLHRQVGYGVFPFALLEQGGQLYGLIRDWGALGVGTEEMPPEKHVSYAVQWFVMAGILVLLYLSAHIRRVDRGAGESEQHDER